MSFIINFKKKYRKEKLKVNMLSGLIVFCSVCAPLSFSILIQQKINAIAAFSIGLSFVFLLFVLAYFRSSAIRNLELKYKQIKTGMRVKKKQSASLYEVIQESPNFFYLKDTLDNKKMMVSKDKLRADFEVEL